jgi:hypothetical protein
MSPVVADIVAKVESCIGPNFGETLKREGIDDSSNLGRVTEVAYEFCVKRWGPSDLYTKTAPTALRIFAAKRLLQHYRHL